MNLPQWMTESLYVQRIGWTLLQSLWQGALIAALLAVMLAMLRRRGPRVRYALCCLAMAALALAPLATFFTNVGSTARTPSPSMAPRASTTIVEHDAGVHANTLPQGDGAATLPNVSAPSSIHGSPQLAQVPLSQRALAMLSSWIPWLVPLWVIGVLAVSLWNLITWCLVQRLASSHTLPVDAALQQLARRLAGRLGLTQLVRLAQSQAVKSPIVIGMFKPLILFPISILTELPFAQLEALIAHELAHILRHDYLVNLLQIGTETLLFYHPATWWISSRIRAEREHCCDDLAISVTQDRTAYVCALAHVAGVRMPSLTPAASGGILLQRLRRVLGMSNTPVDSSSRGVAGVLVSVLCLVGAGVIGAKLPTAYLHAAPPAVTKTELDPNHLPGLVSSGRVLSPDGMPVPAARVSMFLNERFRLLHEPKQLGETTTDANGRYKIVPGEALSLKDDPYATIIVEAPGFAIGGVEAINVLSIRDPVTIRLTASTTLRVRFVDETSKPVAGLRVAIRFVREAGMKSLGNAIQLFGSVIQLPPHVRRRWIRLTDMNGFCTIADLPRDWVIRLEVDDERFARLSVDDDIILGREAVTEAGPIKLKPAASVSGRVSYRESGEPVTGVFVSALENNNGHHSWGSAVTDAHGEYKIRQLNGGVYNLVLLMETDTERAWASAAMADQIVPQGKSILGKDLQLIKGGLITGRVLFGDTKKPVVGKLVGVHGPARPLSGAAIQFMKTDSNGAYSLRVPPGKQYIYLCDQPPVGYVGIEAKEPEVGEGQTVTADLILPRDPAPVLTGRVVNAEGVSVAGATVVAEAGKDYFDTRETQADVFGRFSFLVPIGANVSAVSQSLSTSIPVEILGGEKDLVLRLQPAAEAALVVSVVDIEGRPVKGSRIKLAVDTGDHSESQNLPLRVTDAHGQYIFEKLRTDWRCSLWVDADGYGVTQARVEPLTAGRQNTMGPIILLPEDDRVAGHVTGTDGNPMAGITVEINGGTGNRTTITDDAGHFQLNVVKKARFSLYLRNARGDILGGLVAQAGEMNLKLIYDPERINPAKKEIDP